MKSKNNMNLNQLTNEVVDTLVKKKRSYKLLSKLDFNKITIKDFFVSIYNQIKIDDNHWFDEKYSTYNLIEEIDESISEYDISGTIYYVTILFAKLFSQHNDSKELLDVYGPSNAWGATSDSSGVIDIYYSSNGYLIQSAHLYPNLIRQTYFHVSSNGNLFDRADSPIINSGTWIDNMSDRETNYVFLYDNDGHYSNLKIVNFGGGTPGNPAWVDVHWYYNETALDNRF